MKRIVSRNHGAKKKDIIIAVLINEKLRRKSPKNWDSIKVIRAWRNRL